jgi:E3 ubiquitin-protein ligase DOA10
MLTVMILLAGAAYSQNTNTPTTDVREGTQRARIAEGRASGELTRKEARRLNMQQRHIRRTERRAKADGNVTPQEQKKLRREQNRASRAIRRQKHDAQTKPRVN